MSEPKKQGFDPTKLFIERHRRRYNQTTFAALIGRDRDFVSDVERGVRVPNVADLVEICKATDKPIGHFFTCTEEEFAVERDEYLTGEQVPERLPGQPPRGPEFDEDPETELEGAAAARKARADQVERDSRK
jgi:transcriptional regulator with XRE-family HTH domain